MHSGGGRDRTGPFGSEVEDCAPKNFFIFVPGQVHFRAFGFHSHKEGELKSGETENQAVASYGGGRNDRPAGRMLTACMTKHPAPPQHHQRRPVLIWTLGGCGHTATFSFKEKHPSGFPQSTSANLFRSNQVGSFQLFFFSCGFNEGRDEKGSILALKASAIGKKAEEERHLWP